MGGGGGAHGGDITGDSVKDTSSIDSFSTLVSLQLRAKSTEPEFETHSGLADGFAVSFDSTRAFVTADAAVTLSRTRAARALVGVFSTDWVEDSGVCFAARAGVCRRRGAGEFIILDEFCAPSTLSMSVASASFAAAMAFASMRSKSTPGGVVPLSVSFSVVSAAVRTAVGVFAFVFFGTGLAPRRFRRSGGDADTETGDDAGSGIFLVPCVFARANLGVASPSWSIKHDSLGGSASSMGKQSG